MQERLDLLDQAASEVKAVRVKDVPHRLTEIQADLKETKKANEALQAKVAAQQAGAVFDKVEATAKGSLIAAVVKVAGMGQLRQMADEWRQKNLSDVLVLGTAVDDKANLLVAVSDAKSKELKAGDLIKAIAPAINGGGGGRPTLAQAGGKNPAGLQTAIDQAKEWMK